MRATAQILQILGDRPQAGPVRSTEDLKQWIREGFPFASLESAMTQFGLKREEVSRALDLPSRRSTPPERNYLINPAHPDFGRIRLHAAEPFAFDPRLWKR